MASAPPAPAQKAAADNPELAADVKFMANVIYLKASNLPMTDEVFGVLMTKFKEAVAELNRVNALDTFKPKLAIIRAEKDREQELKDLEELAKADAVEREKEAKEVAEAKKKQEAEDAQTVKDEAAAEKRATGR